VYAEAALRSLIDWGQAALGDFLPGGRRGGRSCGLDGRSGGRQEHDDYTPSRAARFSERVEELGLITAEPEADLAAFAAGRRDDGRRGAAHLRHQPRDQFDDLA
jgi:hypothetical protein